MRGVYVGIGLIPANVSALTRQCNVTVRGALLTPGLVLRGSSDMILETSDFHISFSVKGQCNVDVVFSIFVSHDLFCKVASGNLPVFFFMCTFAMFRQNWVSEMNS